MAWQAETLLRTRVLVTLCRSMPVPEYLLLPGPTAVVMDYLKPVATESSCFKWRTAQQAGDRADVAVIAWQAETLLRTSVMVTPCGSLAALAYLLPPGATAVVMNYMQSETGANVQLDDDAFWNMDHVTLAYYPVGPEDYEGTTVCTH